MNSLVIWWIKRDLRLSDNLALVSALERSRALECPVVALWISEPEAVVAPEFHIRRERFVAEALGDIAPGLKELKVALRIAEGRAVDVFRRLSQRARLHVFSHEETGVLWTFRRDQDVGKDLRARGCHWQEFPTNGVVRRLPDRNLWQGIYQQRMGSDLISRPDAGATVSPETVAAILDHETDPKGTGEGVRIWDWKSRSETSLGRFQKQARFPQQRGGEVIAQRLLQRFLSDEIYPRYLQSLSKPRESQYFSSRLSPYLAFGCLSSRQVVAAIREKERVTEGRSLAEFQNRSDFQNRSLRAFRSRLAWRCHFVQKLENFPEMEGREQNAALGGLRPEMTSEELALWQQGLTGYPLVDACLRSVHQTGFLNFRMRAMLMSFVTHLWWKDWRVPSWDLARAFLDFEPGIHFSQVQMQAAVTGNNQIRIYNPLKQSLEHDPDARFIKQWIPELQAVTADAIHSIEGLPSSYPRPIFEAKQALAHAQTQLFGLIQEPQLRAEAKRVQQRLGSRGGPLSWRSQRRRASKKTSVTKSREVAESPRPMTLFDDEVPGSE